MPILKFFTKDNNIFLEKLRLEDITNDTRTNLLDKESFYKDSFRLENNIYIIENDLFFKFSNFFNKTNIPINAMLLKDNINNIIIVPSRSYVFFNGKSIDVNKYEINITEISIGKLLGVNS